MHLIDMIKEKYVGEREDGEEIWFAKNYINGHVRDLLNIIEDRRIDNWVYKNAPGYRGYYQALYDKYFNSKIIDKALKTDEYTDPNWESFMFRICFMYGGLLITFISGLFITSGNVKTCFHL